MLTLLLPLVCVNLNFTLMVLIYVHHVIFLVNYVQVLQTQNVLNVTIQQITDILMDPINVYVRMATFKILIIFVNLVLPNVKLAPQQQ